MTRQKHDQQPETHFILQAQRSQMLCAAQVASSTARASLKLDCVGLHRLRLHAPVTCCLAIREKEVRACNETEPAGSTKIAVIAPLEVHLRKYHVV